MAEVVLVHGIGDPSDGDGPALTQQWLGALAGGAPPSVAASLQDRCEMVFYRDWSWASDTAQEAQGPSDVGLDGLDADWWADLEELAMAWLTSAREADDDQLVELAVPALAEMQHLDRSGSQGPMRAARSAMALVSHLPWFGVAADHILERTNWASAWQVTSYIRDEGGTKEAVWDRFQSSVGADTRVVISHSLGTVVAYEAIHHLGLELDLFMTIGSPLGLKKVIYPRLIPSATIPPGVKRWANVADPDDFVATAPQLASLFTDSTGEGRSISDVEVHNQGRFTWHNIVTYLAHDIVRSLIWEVLDD